MRNELLRKICVCGGNNWEVRWYKTDYWKEYRGEWQNYEQSRQNRQFRNHRVRKFSYYWRTGK